MFSKKNVNGAVCRQAADWDAAKIHQFRSNTFMVWNKFLHSRFMDSQRMVSSFRGDNIWPVGKVFKCHGRWKIYLIVRICSYLGRIQNTTKAPFATMDLL